MTAIKLSQLLENIAHVKQDCLLSSISDDSRAVTAGGLFVAVRGFGKQHALDFVQQAFEQGAVAVIWEQHADANPSLIPQGMVSVEIADLGQKLGEIAARFYQHPSQSLFVAGVTGTDGKSSCTWLLASAWQAADMHSAVIGTLGNGAIGNLTKATHTTPLPLPLQGTLASLRDDRFSHVAMEVSSHGLDQNRVGGVEFDVAVLTNLQRDHLDYHGSVEAYKEAKRKLFVSPNLKAAVINIDDDFGRELAASISANVISYSTENAEADLFASDIDYQISGLSFSLQAQGTQQRVQTRLIGAFNVQNCLAVVACLLVSGLSLSQAVEQLASITPPPGRMELYSNGIVAALVDYAHTPNALASALKAARQHTEGQLWVVFGCGGDRDVGKRAQMAAMAEKFADKVVMTNDNPRSEQPSKIIQDMLLGLSAPSAANVIEDRQQAIHFALQSAKAADVVVVAGKGHEDYQLIGDQCFDFSDRDCVAEWMAA